MRYREPLSGLVRCKGYMTSITLPTRAPWPGECACGERKTDGVLLILKMGGANSIRILFQWPPPSWLKITASVSRWGIRKGKKGSKIARGGIFWDLNHQVRTVRTWPEIMGVVFHG
jgi:hypothetical protein